MFEGIIDQEKIKENLVPILTVLIIFIFTITVFRNTLSNLLKLREENKNMNTKLAAMTKKSQLLQSLDEPEISKKVEKLEEIFPSDKPVLSLFASLNQLALEENVVFGGIELTPGKLEKIQPSSVQNEADGATPATAVESVESSDLQEVEISFNIEGQLEDITDFIRQLEKNSPLTQIESVSLSLDGLIAFLKVKVFYQGFPESLGSVEKPVPVLTEKEKEILAMITDFRKVEKIEVNAPTGKENIFSLP